VVADREAFDSNFTASFIGLSLSIGGLYYQVFDGMPQDQQKVLIRYIDEATGERSRLHDLPDREVATGAIVAI
jgi:hypothetical protein